MAAAMGGEVGTMVGLAALVADAGGPSGSVIRGSVPVAGAAAVTVIAAAAAVIAGGRGRVVSAVAVGRCGPSPWLGPAVGLAAVCSLVLSSLACAALTVCTLCCPRSLVLTKYC